MVGRDNEYLGGDGEENSHVERALVTLIRSILSPEQQQLLVAFDAITDPKVRQSLIDIALAAAKDTGGLPRRDATREEPPRDHCFEVLGEIRIRRVRGELQHRVWKDRCHESGE